MLHYLSDGTVKLMFSYKKALYFVPVMLVLKALVDEPDSYIYNELTRNMEKDTFFKGYEEFYYSKFQYLVFNFVLNHVCALTFQLHQKHVETNELF